MAMVHSNKNQNLTTSPCFSTKIVDYKDEHCQNIIAKPLTFIKRGHLADAGIIFTK